MIHSAILVAALLASATKEEVHRAARVANAHTFIAALPEAYDMVVGERGTRLSGGERQRIALARAILSDRPILIFDEATSALDTESERLVQEAVGRLMGGRTVLVIAHRLSTVRRADLILVLSGGRIVERGDQATLLALKGRYKELYDKQYGIEVDRFVNPGEDFTPDLPETDLPKAGRGL